MLLPAIARQLARLGAADEPGGTGPSAAVAAIFRQRPGFDSAELLFIRRAERASDPWSGHIAFPGGRHEPADVTRLTTAIRETHEEVGIDLSRADLVARLPDIPAFVRTKRASLVVTPFVFALPGDVELTPNVDEVAETLWIPFSTIARGEGRGTFSWTWEGKTLELPCIRFPPAQHVLWGMTYRMVEMLLEALGPEDDTPGPSSRTP